MHDIPMAIAITQDTALALREQLRHLTSYSQHVLTCCSWETGGCDCGLEQVLKRTPELVALLDKVAQGSTVGTPGSQKPEAD
jgi:hypothetical protein